MTTGDVRQGHAAMSGDSSGRHAGGGDVRCWLLVTDVVGDVGAGGACARAEPAPSSLENKMLNTKQNTELKTRRDS